LDGFLSRPSQPSRRTAGLSLSSPRSRRGEAGGPCGFRHSAVSTPAIGTEGAALPFWSPDGRFIAFAADGRLKRIATTGAGAPHDVAVTKGYWGGTWSSDETIVFANTTGLHRVSADGSEASRLTRIDDSRGEISHRFPLMLSDNRRFLYLVLSTQEEHQGLYLGSLDDPTMKRRVVSTDANAAIGTDSRGGEVLFFVRDFTLLAQPFDAVRGALAGSPTVIANSILWELHRRAIAGGDDTPLFVGRVPLQKFVRDVTRDGRFLLFEGRGAGDGLWVLPLAGEQRPYVLIDTPAAESHGPISPDGRWLAYNSDETGESEVYVTAFPVPGERFRISTSGGRDPQWRGDGRELYYVAADHMLMAVGVADGARFEVQIPEPLFRMSPDPLSLEFGSVYAPSPDGQRFLVVEIDKDDKPQLIVTLNWTHR
jgi:hypothetical protein